MEHSRPTQVQRIHDYMTMYGGITQFEALRDLGVMRLASRISEMRKQGYIITSRVETVKNRWDEPCYVKRYSLAKDGESDGRCEVDQAGNGPA